MIDLIKAAVLTNNPTLQKTAENTLLKLRLEQTQQFFFENVNILQNQKMAIEIRQAAATLLISSAKFKNNNSFLWDNLTPSGKASFKNLILGSMVDINKIIRRSAANIVAALCCIDIPRKQWQGIVQTMTANMTHKDLTVKEVSILTIGFICQQLKQLNFQFQQAQQQTILTGILLGLKDPQREIVQTAFKALRDGIPAVSSLMSNRVFREYLIAQIAEGIQSKTYAQYGIQCLTQFIKYNFQYLEDNYVQGFASLVGPFLANTKQESTCILAMDFWATFAKQEKSVQDNPQRKILITGKLADQLVQSLLQNLCELQQGDEQGNGVSDAAENALQAIFQGNSSNYQTRVLAFSQSTISHSSWKKRQGSIRAFANLLLGLPQQVSQGLVNTSLTFFVGLLNDQSQVVQASAIKSLNLISEQAGKVIVHHQHFIAIVQLLTKKAEEKQLFLLHSCKIIEQLCEVSNSKAFFQPICDQLIRFFLRVSLEANRSINAVLSCICTILSLVTNSENIVLANKYIDYVINNSNQLHSLQKQKEFAFYAGFCTLSQVCLITIRKAKGSITVDQMSRLYQFVMSYFTKLSNVQGDGFYVVSALTFFIPHDLRIVNDFWKFIEFGLKKVNQSDVFKAVISCICDFAATYKDKISEKVDYAFKELITLFESLTLVRELKVDILMCFGQLILHCGQTSSRFLKKIMDLMLASIQSYLQIKDIEYAETLQQTIVETFMCIYHGFKNSVLLIEYVKYIHKFVEVTTDKSRHPKLEYVKSSMILLADIAYIYPSQSHRILDRHFILDRVNILNKYNSDGALSNEIRYIMKEFGIKNN